MSNTLNFGTIRPTRVAEWLNSFVALPAFTYSGIGWKGASEIVTQFNYTATKNFTLRELPETPVGVNFCLVIRYRIGLTSYRYKLWNNVGEVLNEPLYNGEVIKKNFVLEIWNTETSEDVSLAESIKIKTSIRKIPITYASLDEYADNTVVAEAPNQLTSPLDSIAIPTTGLLAHYNNADMVIGGPNVTAWNDLVGGFNINNVAGAITVVPNAKNGYNGAKFNGSGILEGMSPFSSLGGAGVDVVIAAIKQNSWLDADTILAVLDPNPSDTQGVQQKGNEPGIRPLAQATYSPDDCLILPVGSFDILRYIGNLNTSESTVDILGNGQVTTGVVPGTTQGTNFRLGPADVTILEVACYNGALVTDYDSIYQYFLAKFSLGVSLPFTVDSANPWLTN